MSIVDLYGHERLRERIAGAISPDALPSSMLFHGPRGVGKQRLALWLGQALLCTGTAPRPCGACPQCRFSLALTHPDLQWVFPRPRLKDSDPSREDVRDDYAQAIAERTAKNGLYTPPSGSDGIFVATIRAVVRAAVRRRLRLLARDSGVRGGRFRHGRPAVRAPAEAGASGRSADRRLAARARRTAGRSRGDQRSRSREWPARRGRRRARAPAP